MTLIHEIESNSHRVYTLTKDEINQALTYYKKAGYHFTTPETLNNLKSLVSDIAYVSSKNRKEIQQTLRFLQGKSGFYKINLTKKTQELRDFLFKTTCRFSTSPKPTNNDSLSRKEIQARLKELRRHPDTSKYLTGVKLNQKTSILQEILANITNDKKHKSSHS